MKALLAAACGLAAMSAGTVWAAEPALKDVFAKHFRVGAAISTPQVEGREPEAMELAARQFNTITPENLLKWADVHPEPERFYFDAADKYVAWGEEHGMFIVGHTLVWHNQTPEWAFAGKGDEPLDRETALARLKEHITTIVGRYKGRINGWDVVNEAIDDSGRLRTGPVGEWPHRGEPWHAAIGDDYLEHAFRFANAADPDAELYYNDFNEWYPAKIEAVSKLVREFQEKGVRIDGIGLQGHWGMDYPKLEEIDHMLVEYGKLGVKLMITELDINVVRQAEEGTDAEVTRRGRRAGGDPYADGLPPELEEKLAQRYAEIFKLLVKHSDKIERVTFWGVHDGQSWLNYMPPGRRNFPLLFDSELKPKAAFEAVIDAANPS